MGRVRGASALIGACTVALLAAPPAVAEEGPTVRLVVELDDMAKARGLDVDLTVPTLDAVVVEVPAAEVATTAARLRSSGAGRIEVDTPVEVAVAPNDPLWTDQWGPRLMGMEDAWARTTGAPTTRVAVLDTGVDLRHPDLVDAVIGGTDVENGDPDFADDNGHGTAVAGIIAARRGNGIGVAGYCGRCSLLAVKVLDGRGTGDGSVVAAGIVWAVDHGASVINLSLTSPSSSFVLSEAISYAVERDVVVVSASGNDGLLQPTFPAAYPDVLGVVGSDPTDSIYAWSNRGTWAAIAAPGCHRTTSASSYADLCGTSSAAPAIAGIAALLRSAAPDASATRVRAALVEHAVVLRNNAARRPVAPAAIQAVLREEPVAAANEVLDGAPGPPRGVRARSSSSGATVTWMAPDDPGLTPLLGYEVTTLPGGAVQSVPATATTATVGGLVSGITYRFSVAARNAKGTGPASPATTPITPVPGGLSRVAGEARALTSVALSQRSFLAASTVVISRADDHADALAAAPLAAKLGAPLLLSAPGALPVEVGDEIRRLGATVAHLVGGPGALSTELEASMAWWGVTNVVRTAGRDRFETAATIARQIGGREVYVANGMTGWADAVAVSALAAAQARPILLVTRGAVPAATRAALLALDADAAIVVGGRGVVDDDVLEVVADPGGDFIAEVAVSRLAGDDRYETSRRIAEVAEAAGADPSRVWLASGRSWPDALAAGPAVAARGGLLLLVPGDDLASSADTASWLADHAVVLEEVVLVGGLASIGARVEEQLLQRLARL